jgi:hypothetical protein
MRLSNDQFDSLVDDQLANGVLLAPYRFFTGATLTLDDARARMLLDFEQKLAADPLKFSPFTEDDFDVMAQDQLLAVTHTAHTSPGPGLDYTPFISTADRWAAAIDFALAKQNDVRLVLAIEMPGNAGIKYVPTANNTAGGQPVLRHLNFQEGEEIAFLDDMHFKRCFLFKVIPNGALDSTGAYALEFVDEFNGTGS